MCAAPICLKAGTIDYINGKDFILNGANGSLRRTPASRIPDYRTNMLFGKEWFDHSQFPGFGNAGFFVFVDYAYVKTNDWPVQGPRPPCFQPRNPNCATASR